MKKLLSQTKLAKNTIENAQKFLEELKCTGASQLKMTFVSAFEEQNGLKRFYIKKYLCGDKFWNTQKSDKN